MKKDSFVFYRSFYESIKELDNKSKLEIYEAIAEYSLNQNITELSGISKAIFILIKPQIDANFVRYENGKKGGRPKEKETKTKPKRNQNETKTKPNDNVNDNVNDNNKEIYKEKYFNNEELNNLFLEFLDLRKKLKAVNNERAITMLIKKLEQFDNETKIELINESIVNSWKSIFPKKQTKENNSPSWFNKEIKEDLMTDAEIEKLKEEMAV